MYAHIELVARPDAQQGGEDLRLSTLQTRSLICLELPQYDESVLKLRLALQTSISRECRQGVRKGAPLWESIAS